MSREESRRVGPTGVLRVLDRNKTTLGGGGELDAIAHLLQTSFQTVGDILTCSSLKVLRAEILVVRIVLQHVIGRGEDGGGHRDDGLLGATSGAQAMKLGMQIRLRFRSALGAHTGPC